MVDLEINKGDLFVITLTSNPTTGFPKDCIDRYDTYDWFIQHMNSDILTLLENEFINSNTDILGASGKRIMTFKCLNKTNKTKLVLVYKRPWEKEVLEKKREYTIRII